LSHALEDPLGALANQRLISTRLTVSTPDKVDDRLSDGYGVDWPGAGTGDHEAVPEGMD